MRGVLAGEGGVGGKFEGGEDNITLTFKVFLNSFEVLARELVREAEKWLVLCDQVAYQKSASNEGGEMGEGGIRARDDFRR